MAKRGNTTGHCDVDFSVPVADQCAVRSHDVNEAFILYEEAGSSPQQAAGYPKKFSEAVTFLPGYGGFSSP